MAKGPALRSGRKAFSDEGAPSKDWGRGPASNRLQEPGGGPEPIPASGSHNLGWDSLQGPHFHSPSPPEDSPLSPGGAPDTGSDAPAAQMIGPRWLGPRRGAGAVLRLKLLT